MAIMIVRQESIINVLLMKNTGRYFNKFNDEIS